MRPLDVVDLVLLIAVIMMMMLVSYGVAASEDMPRSLKLPLIKSRIRTGFVVFVNFVLISFLLVVVFNTTSIFRWISLSLLGLGLLWLIAAILRRMPKDNTPETRE